MSAFIEGVRVPLVKHVRCLTLSGPSSSADIFFSIRRSYKAIYLFSQYRIKFASISSLRPAARSRIKTGRSALFQTAGNQKHCSPSLDSEQSIAHYTAELLTQATSRCEWTTVQDFRCWTTTVSQLKKTANEVATHYFENTFAKAVWRPSHTPSARESSIPGDLQFWAGIFSLRDKVH